MKTSSAPRASAILLLLTGARSLVGVVLASAYTVFCSFFVISAGVAGSTPLASRVIRFWALGLLKIFSLRVRVRGQENLPATGGGIVVFNHQSHFDIPAIICSATVNFRFGAKVELFKIPFFGPGMRAVGTLPIARDNRAEVIKIYAQAKKRFNENIIYVLAPEGTRQAEPALGKFKKGPFIFAMEAGVPLIPVVIRGAYQVLPKHGLFINLGQWTRTIDVDILPIESAQGFTKENIESLIGTVRDKMNSAYLQ